MYTWYKFTKKIRKLKVRTFSSTIRKLYKAWSFKVAGELSNVIHEFVKEADKVEQLHSIHRLSVIALLKVLWLFHSFIDQWLINNLFNLLPEAELHEQLHN